MAILQALVTLVGRSLGKLLDAIFGWAVVALFGRTSPREQTVLSVLVGCAAAWPILLVGIAVPRLAAYLLAFVPLSNQVPKAIVRAVWIVLALAVPIAVGIVLARRHPARGPQERPIVRLLRGFPTTLAIATAFLLMFVTVPVLRIASLARKRRDEHVPCIADEGDYAVVAAQVERVLDDGGLHATRRPPPWWLAAPAGILRALGGPSVRGVLPAEAAYWKGAAIEVALHPSDVLVRGDAARVAWVHGLLAEALARGPGVQTFAAATQDLERQLHRIWDTLDAEPRAHRDAAALRARLREVLGDLAALPVEYEDWDVVYRQILQVGRALDGRKPLLASLSGGDEPPIAAPGDAPLDAPLATPTPRAIAQARPLAEVPTGELLRTLFDGASALVKKEIALAKAEWLADKDREVHAFKGLAFAAVCGLATLDMLLLAAAFALAQRLPGWAAALIVGAPLLVATVAATAIGWSSRVQHPFARTRKTLEEDVQWMKERTA